MQQFANISTFPSPLSQMILNFMWALVFSETMFSWNQLIVMSQVLSRSGKLLPNLVDPGKKLHKLIQLKTQTASSVAKAS